MSRNTSSSAAPRSTARFRSTWVLMAALLVVSCTGKAGDLPASVDGDYRLISGTIDGEPVPLQESHPVTLTINGDQVRGTAACNEYGGNVLIEGNHIAVSDLATTEMACFPVEAMTTGRIFLGALAEVDTFDLEGETLTLTGDGTEMRLTKQQPAAGADLNGTVWVLNSLIDGESVSSVTPDRSTVEFYTDGSVLGSTGCRSFHGHYATTGSEVKISDFTVEGTCDGVSRDPQMQQDSQVVQVLGHDFGYVIEAATMTVQTTGNWGLVYVAGH